MIASEDVRRVTFDKAMRGYRSEDVDDYLKKVADTIDSLQAENDDLQKKLVVLAQRIDQYRTEEATLNTILINAQRMAENLIKEAKQKAGEVLRAANIKAEDREQRARDDVELSKQELTTLKKETSDFKKTLLSMYRKHVELISGIPEYNITPDTQGPDRGIQEQPAEQEPTPAVQQQAEPQPMEQPDYPEQPQYPEPEYDEPEQPAQPPEADAPGVVNEGKIDTVEFAIAPREEPETPPTTESFTNPFAPGAGLYDAPDGDGKPAAKPKKTASRGRKKPTGQPASDQPLPQAFDSFSGIDFDS